MITQILLVVASYINRIDKTYLTQQSRSSVYINTISNRLSASSQRASFLGMLVGTAVSELVDPEGKRMKFSMEELDSVDGKWYRSLTTIEDKVGIIEDLKIDVPQAKKPPAAKDRIPRVAKQYDTTSSNAGAASRVIAIEEVQDDIESEDEDIVMYQKPDSDASDEDEDPTLVQRDRPSAPV